MKASVIVPGYNVEHVVGACLDALLHQTVPMSDYEVIYVDDASQDGTLQVLADYPSVQLLTMPENRGQATARNKGLEVARGEIILFTDADCIPVPNWIEAMLSAFDDPQIAGTKGVYCTKQTSLVAQFAQVEYESRYAKMAQQPYIDFIDTYSAGYRREVLEHFGGFDPRFRIDEDQELSFRVAAEGLKMTFNPAALVEHRHPATVRRYARRKYDIGYWKAFVLALHPEKSSQDSHTPQRLKLQLGLAALAVGGILLGWLWPPFFLLGLTSLVAMAATALPLLRRASERDRRLGWVAPGLVALRAVALGSGLAVGLVSVALKRGPVRS